jgi:hypothetical protein
MPDEVKKESAGAPKRKRPATQREIEKQLKTIYDRESPSDFSKLERVTRRRWPKFVLTALFLFILAGAAWFGIMRWGNSGRYGDNIAITVDGPASVRSGEVSEWTITYKNNENLPIASADVTLRLPPSISVLSTEPLAIDKNLDWKIGTLEPGSEGKITLRGLVTDAVGADASVQAVLAYRPANFNADFQKVATWEGPVADAIIEATLTAPDEAVPTDASDFSISIKRRDDISPNATLPDLTVRFDTGDAVIVKSSDPAFSYAADKSWSAKLPDAGKESDFKCTGNFTSGSNGDVVVKAEVGTTDAGGNYIVLAPLMATVKVTPGDLVLTLIRNGSPGDSTANFGDTLHVSVDYENQSAKPVSDAKIALVLDDGAANAKDSILDWTTLSDPRGGVRSGNTLTWTKGQIAELATLAPGDKGTVDVSLKIVGAPPADGGPDFAVALSATGTIGALGGKVSGKTVVTPILKTALNTDAAFFAAAAWSDGPLPPKTGNKTTYKIVWTLANSLHEISGINVNAALPDGVNWENKSNVSAGDLRFDAASRNVVWTLNRLPTSIKNVSLEFYVSVSPGNNDVGKSLPLTSDASFAATDKDTGATVTRSAPGLDTNIQSDTDNAGIVLP